ncbi:MAG: mechanosensitive ion channel family protein [Gemmatimonadota bacterium]
MKWLPFSIDPAQWQALLILVAPRLAAALIILGLFWLALRLTRPALRGALRRATFDEGLITLLVDGLFRGIVVLFALVMASSQLGINVSALLAGVGVAGIALGFAAQETVANMIAGFLIFWDRPFRIGDFITTQTRYGRVREITLRTTRIRTLDNTFVVIPNRQIIGDTLINHSMYGETRVVVPIGIAYKEKIAAARAALLPAVRGIDGVMELPAPDVVARSLGDSSVNLEVRVWISDAARERPIAAQVVEVGKLALDLAGIEIPFPHLQLFVENIDERVWAKAATLAGRGSAS